MKNQMLEMMLNCVVFNPKSMSAFDVHEREPITYYAITPCVRQRLTVDVLLDRVTVVSSQKQKQTFHGMLFYHTHNMY